jgi:hypothetical protein
MNLYFLSIYSSSKKEERESEKVRFRTLKIKPNGKKEGLLIQSQKYACWYRNGKIMIEKVLDSFFFKNLKSQVEKELRMEFYLEIPRLHNSRYGSRKKENFGLRVQAHYKYYCELFGG